MNSSGISSDLLPPADRMVAIALLALSAILFAGCAARRPLAPPESVPVKTAPGTPGRPAGEDTKVPASTQDAPALPGADRVYPSQDERNQAPPDAAEAFPLPGASAGTRAEATPPASEPTAGSRGASRARPSPSAARGTPPPSVLPPSSSGEQARPSGGRGGTVFSVQLFASASPELAARRSTDLKPYFASPLRVEDEDGLFKVRVGLFATRTEAEKLRRRAGDLGFRDAFVVGRPAPGKGGP